MFKIKTVLIKPSIFTYAFSALLIGIACWLFGGLIYTMYQQFFGTDKSTVQDLIGIALFVLIIGSLLLIFGLNISMRRYEVSLKGVHIKTLFRNVFIDWETVKKMLIIPTFQGANNIGLLLKDGRRYGLSIAILARYSFSEKAIIEAAHLANPDIETDAGLGLKNGNPPYGIFLDLPEY